ncbi:hypothetical protein D3C72_2163150 [compost metagenome]
MMFFSPASNASPKESVAEVAMFIHRISTGVSGIRLPASRAIIINSPCARLVGMIKRMVFFRLS